MKWFEKYKSDFEYRFKIDIIILLSLSFLITMALAIVAAKLLQACAGNT
jgi:hypothetical protein